MDDTIERMKQEHRELETKLKELNAFIFRNEVFKTLKAFEQVRMIQQSGFMKAYLDILAARIWAAS